MPAPASGDYEPEGAPEHDSGRKYDEVNVVISDLHMGEGPQVRLQYGGRRGLSRLWRVFLHRVLKRGSKYETINNRLEEFHYDSELADFLELIAERYSDAAALKLRLLGDIFDPLTVSWEGQYLDPPYEHVAVAKLQRMIDRHPEAIAALRNFVTHANCSIYFIVGNHDLLLCWPKVQQLLRSVLAGDDSELNSRIEFIDHKKNFRVKERGVLYEHGNFAEPHNCVKPEDLIVTDVLGAELKYPILNQPYGSYMFVDMVTRLKYDNQLISRVRSEQRVWNHALRYRWIWGLKAGVLLVWHFIYSHFFALADIRRKATLRKILDIVAWTTSNQSVDGYANKLMRRNEDCKVVVLGHSHNWRRVSSDRGTYINVGNWSCSYRLEEPEFELRWNRLPRVEFAWRALQHFFVTGEVRFAWRMTKFVGVLAMIAAMVAFILGAFDGGDWTFWPLPAIVVKVFVSAILIFISAAGIFRLFSAEPYILPDTRFTFGLIRFKHDGELRADLMEFDPKTRSVHVRV